MNIHFTPPNNRCLLRGFWVKTSHILDQGVLLKQVGLLKRPIKAHFAHIVGFVVVD